MPVLSSRPKVLRKLSAVRLGKTRGVVVGRVVIHPSQPLPHPAHLMIGAITQTIPGGDNFAKA